VWGGAGVALHGSPQLLCGQALPRRLHSQPKILIKHGRTIRLLAGVYRCGANPGTLRADTIDSTSSSRQASNLMQHKERWWGGTRDTYLHLLEA
jgi:hypothetical protein